MKKNEIEFSQMMSLTDDEMCNVDGGFMIEYSIACCVLVGLAVYGCYMAGYNAGYNS